MNLHKSKGLEALVVFLANPRGKNNRAKINIHTKRDKDKDIQLHFGYYPKRHKENYAFAYWCSTCLNRHPFHLHLNSKILSDLHTRMDGMANSRNHRPSCGCSNNYIDIKKIDNNAARAKIRREEPQHGD